MLRNEYPRPDFVRKNWFPLNGEWEFEFDDQNVGLAEGWFNTQKKLSKTIVVPFCFESELSGIGDTSVHENVWYKRKFNIPLEYKNKKIILHFGAVDYYAKVFVNGMMVGEHTGGHTNFLFDITDYLHGTGEQDVTVYVHDPFSEEIPRGKQFWKEKSDGIWYTRTTGIWQSVWLEPLNETHLKKVRFTPDVDKGFVEMELITEFKSNDTWLDVEITFSNEFIVKDTIHICSNRTKRSFDVLGSKIFNSNAHGWGMLWWPECPNLFDVKLGLRDGQKKVDEVKTYFGMRKIHTENGMTFLNNRPYYMQLVLDQGYWKRGLMTAPCETDYAKDIELSKQMGFNGCRKHKAEDPQFFYWADKLGYLVWSEMAATCVFSSDSAKAVRDEWSQIIERDYNHPSIVTWVSINESWGVSQIDRDQKQQHHSLALYHMIKSCDNTRLVVGNDGWEMTKTDICAIHNYAHGSDNEPQKYSYFSEVLASKEKLLRDMSAGRNIYVSGFSYENEPILLTECGGIAYVMDATDGWGYTVARSEEEFVRQYERVIRAIKQSNIIYGFCYTQLTDIEQEINGLLTYDRLPKCDPQKIKEINTMWRHNMVIDDRG